MVLKCMDEERMRSLILDRELTLIGSDVECDFCLASEAVAPVAAHVERRPSGWFLRPAGGDASLELNGALLGSAEGVQVSPGDRLIVGSKVIWFDMLELRRSEEEAPISEAYNRDRLQVFQEALSRLAREAAREESLPKLMEHLLKMAMEVTKGTEAFLFTLGPDGQPQVVVSSGVEKAENLFSDTIVKEALQSGHPTVVSDTSSDERYGTAQSILDLRLHTVVCAPIVSAGQTIGLVYVGCRQGGRAYGREDGELMEVFALLAGMLIHHVDYIERQKKAIERLASDQQGGIIGRSPALRKSLEALESVAPSDITVMIQGETGTGKEVAARYLHLRSERAQGPFIALNISSLRGELLESELFGYRKGAFTGAVQDRKGLFQAANGGTLFLDEIGEMDASLQAKLLRALESGCVRRVGAVEEEQADVRVVCATHRDLRVMVEEGSFREDLYYRIAQVSITLPPLRERGEDILLLAYHYLEQFRVKYPHKQVRDFHPDAIKAMMSHEWPGNIRELVNVIHRSVLQSLTPRVELDAQVFKPRFAALEEATKRFQKGYIGRALAMSQGNKEAAAELLGMSRSTFFRYLSQLEVK